MTMRTRMRMTDILNVGRGHLAAGRKIPTTLMILVDEKNLLLRRRLTTTIQKYGKMGLARRSIVIKPVPLVERRPTLSSFLPSRTGPNGAPGGRTVSKQ